MTNNDTIDHYGGNGASNGQAQPVAHGRARETIELPRIAIRPDTYAQLLAYARSCRLEISGFALVERRADQLVVGDLFVPPQHCTAASTDIEPEDQAAMLDRLHEEGVDLERLRVFWHSHCDMQAFFSGRDRDSMDSSFPLADWIVGIVLNRAGELRAALQIQWPVRAFFDELAVSLYVEPETLERVVADVRDKVRPVGGAALPRTGPGPGLVVSGAMALGNAPEPL